MSIVITTILHIHPGQSLALPAKFKLAGIIVTNNEILQIKHSSRHDITNLSWLKLLASTPYLVIAEFSDHTWAAIIIKHKCETHLDGFLKQPKVLPWPPPVQHGH